MALPKICDHRNHVYPRILRPLARQNKNEKSSNNMVTFSFTTEQQHRHDLHPLHLSRAGRNTAHSGISCATGRWSSDGVAFGVGSFFGWSILKIGRTET